MNTAPLDFGLNTVPIVAIATAPGRGGIGIVRVSGFGLEVLIKQLVGRTLVPRHASYLAFLDADGTTIDQGIALYFPAPHSYTGEEVLELQGHGGPAVLKRLLQRCLSAGESLGLRLAQPGEFTQRAFLNQRLDLAQAEAVADLIEATTEAAAKSAMASLSGAFSVAVHALVGRLTELRILVEATLDFPEEEIEFLEKYQARHRLQAMQDDLDTLLASARQGALLREGLKVVLAGQPNVGKSSLLNALAGEDIAIVTPIAGTTRDKVVQQIHLNGIPLHIIDTAGLRETSDEVEGIGIDRSWREIAQADVILYIRDASEQNPNYTQLAEQDILARLPLATPRVTVLNKIDLCDADILRAGRGGNTSGNTSTSSPCILVSAKTGEGLENLKTALLELAGWQATQESPFLARERHIVALEQAHKHLQEAARHAAQDDRVLDLFAEDLRLAQDSLAKITGAFSSDDLLGAIFSQFCIGK